MGTKTSTAASGPQVSGFGTDGALAVGTNQGLSFYSTTGELLSQTPGQPVMTIAQTEFEVNINKVFAAAGRASSPTYAQNYSQMQCQWVGWGGGQARFQVVDTTLDRALPLLASKQDQKQSNAPTVADSNVQVALWMPGLKALQRPMRLLLGSTSNDQAQALHLFQSSEDSQSMVYRGSLQGHPRAVFRLIPLADPRVMSLGEDGLAKVWNTDTGECEQTLPRAWPSDAVALPDGRVLLTCLESEMLHWLYWFKPSRDYEVLTKERKELRVLKATPGVPPILRRTSSLGRAYENQGSKKVFEIDRVVDLESPFQDSRVRRSLPLRRLLLLPPLPDRPGLTVAAGFENGAIMLFDPRQSELSFEHVRPGHIQSPVSVLGLLPGGFYSVGEADHTLYLWYPNGKGSWQCAKKLQTQASINCVGLLPASWTLLMRHLDEALGKDFPTVLLDLIVLYLRG